MPQVRAAYVQPIKDRIHATLKTAQSPLKVLEVGCGNGTNLMLLKEEFGNAVQLWGIDISQNRIEVGRQ